MDRPEECATEIHNSVPEYVDSTTHDLLRLSLASREYSPRLQTYKELRSVYENDTSCCVAVVDGYNVVSESIHLEKIVTEKFMSRSSRNQEVLYDFDHPHPDGVTEAKSSQIMIVLYGALDASCSHVLHKSVKGLLEEYRNQILYVWRPVQMAGLECGGACSSLGMESSVKVSGYGVELAIKNMEYSAHDDTKNATQDDEIGDAHTQFSSDTEGFNIPKLIERYPDQKHELEAFGSHLIESSSLKRSNLKVWEMKDLGLQATQRIISSSNGLQMLRDVSQNFPSLVEMISKLDISKELRESQEDMGRMISAEHCFVLVNGIIIDTRDLNWYNILTIIRREFALMNGLRKVGLREQEIKSVIDFRAEKSSDGQEEEFRLFFNPLSEVVWINDLEKDPKYASLPKSLNNLMQPTFMGQAVAIRRNVFTGIFVVDMSTRGGASLVKMIDTLLSQGLPVRTGIMPVSMIEGEPSSEISILFCALHHLFGGGKTSQLFSAAAGKVEKRDWDNGAQFGEVMLNKVSSHLENEWTNLGSATSKLSFSNFMKEIRDPSSPRRNDAISFLSESNTLARKLGINKIDEAGGIFLMNGLIHHIESTSLWRSMIINAWQAEMGAVQQEIYAGRLRDDSLDLLDDILSLHGALPKYNPRILKKSGLLGDVSSMDNMKYVVDLSKGGDFVKWLHSLELQFQGLSERDSKRSTTHLVFINPLDQVGRSLLASSLKFESERSRIGIVINANRTDCQQEATEFELLVAAMATGKLGKASRADILDLLVELESLKLKNINEMNITELLRGLESFSSIVDHLEDWRKALPALLQRHCEFARNKFHLGMGTSAVASNGQVHISRNVGDLTEEDFGLLEYSVSSQGFASDQLISILSSEHGDNLNDVASLVSNILLMNKPGQVRK